MSAGAGGADVDAGAGVRFSEEEAGETGPAAEGGAGEGRTKSPIYKEAGTPRGREPGSSGISEPPTPSRSQYRLGSPSSDSSRSSIRRAKPNSSPKTVKLDHILTKKSKQMAAGTGPWIMTPCADMVFASVVVLNAACLGWEVHLDLETAHGDEGATMATATLVIDLIFTVVFAVEFALRVRGVGRKFFLTKTGAFDAVLLLLAFLDVVQNVAPVGKVKFITVFRLFRLARVARIVRLFFMFPDLQLLIRGLLGTMSSISYCALLIGLCAYSGALVCSMTVGKSDACAESGLCVSDLFLNIGDSFLSHVKLTLMQGWPDVAAPMMADNAAWAVYVILFICLTNIALLNVLTGVVCEHVLALAKTAEPCTPEAFMKHQEEIAERVEKLFYRACSIDGSDELTTEEYLNLLKSVKGKQLLHDMHIGLPLHPEDLLTVIDETGAGTVGVDTFKAGLLRLQGSVKDRQSQIFQCTLLSSSRVLLEHLAQVQGEIRETMKETVHRSGLALVKEVDLVAAALLLPLEPKVSTLEEKAPDMAEGFEEACADLEAVLAGLSESLQKAHAPPLPAPPLPQMETQDACLQVEDEFTGGEHELPLTTTTAASLRASRYVFFPGVPPAAPQESRGGFFERLARNQLSDGDVSRLVKAGYADHHHKVGIERRRRIFGMSGGSPLKPPRRSPANAEGVQASGSTTLPLLNRSLQEKEGAMPQPTTLPVRGRFGGQGIGGSLRFGSPRLGGGPPQPLTLGRASPGAGEGGADAAASVGALGRFGGAGMSSRARRFSGLGRFSGAGFSSTASRYGAALRPPRRSSRGAPPAALPAS